MRSKTSCFNGTLFRKNLSRYWPLWGLASFGGAMFPLAMLLELLHDGFRFWSPLETRQAYYTVLSYGVPVISIVYAILCAMAVQITDPVADMLTRIRNANSAKHETVDVPASNLKKDIAKILLDEGYIKASISVSMKIFNCSISLSLLMEKIFTPSTIIIFALVFVAFFKSTKRAS